MMGYRFGGKRELFEACKIISWTCVALFHTKRREEKNTREETTRTTSQLRFGASTLSVRCKQQPHVHQPTRRMFTNQHSLHRKRYSTKERKFIQPQRFGSRFQHLSQYPDAFASVITCVCSPSPRPAQNQQE